MGAITPNERSVAEDRRDCYTSSPTLTMRLPTRAIRDSAQLPCARSPILPLGGCANEADATVEDTNILHMRFRKLRLKNCEDTGGA